MEHKTNDVGTVKTRNKNKENDSWKKYNSSKEDDLTDDSVEEEYCSDATYLARRMASAEKLRESEIIVIIFREIQYNERL